MTFNRQSSRGDWTDLKLFFGLLVIQKSVDNTYHHHLVIFVMIMLVNSVTSFTLGKTATNRCNMICTNLEYLLSRHISLANIHDYLINVMFFITKCVVKFN